MVSTVANGRKRQLKEASNSDLEDLDDMDVEEGDLIIEEFEDGEEGGLPASESASDSLSVRSEATSRSETPTVVCNTRNGGAASRKKSSVGSKLSARKKGSSSVGGAQRQVRDQH